MPRGILLFALSLAVTLSAACSFSIGEQYESEKATQLVNESNKLNGDAEALLKEALSKYSAIYDEAQKADDPFEELGAQGDAFKKLEPQIESVKGKLKDASQKLDEATKLKLPDWYKQSLANLSEINKSGSESAGLMLQIVKDTYDPSIQSPEDLDAKQKALMEKLAAESKRRDGLKAANDKLFAEHKDELK